MKNLMISLMALASFSAFAGKSITCVNMDDSEMLSGTKQNGEVVFTNDGSGAGQDWTAGVYGKMNLPCKDSEGNRYIVTMEGIGAGLHFDGFGAAVLTCPLVRKKHFVGVYGGIKIAAGALGGAKVGIFSNKRLGACMLTGLDVVALGASVKIGKMEIVRAD